MQLSNTRGSDPLHNTIVHSLRILVSLERSLSLSLLTHIQGSSLSCTHRIRLHRCVAIFHRGRSILMQHRSAVAACTLITASSSEAVGSVPIFKRRRRRSCSIGGIRRMASRTSGVSIRRSWYFKPASRARVHQHHSPITHRHARALAHSTTRSCSLSLCRALSLPMPIACTWRRRVACVCGSKHTKPYRTPGDRTKRGTCYRTGARAS